MIEDLNSAFTLVGDGGNHFTNGSIFPGGHTTFIENNTVVKGLATAHSSPMTFIQIR